MITISWHDRWCDRCGSLIKAGNVFYLSQEKVGHCLRCGPRFDPVEGTEWRDIGYWNGNL